MSESNLARSLFSASQDPNLGKKASKSEVTPEKTSGHGDCERKLQALNLEIDILQQNVAKWEAEYQTKCDYIELLETELAQVNSDREQRIQGLIAQVEQAEVMVQRDRSAWQQEKQQLLAKFEATRQQDLVQITKQNSVQARLQQSLQLVEAEHVTTKSRLQELEQQTVEMQEQILQQACQTAEYEAAIQHWKDKALHHQRHALQLSSALDRFLETKGEDTKPVQNAPVDDAIFEAEIVTPPPVENHNRKPTSPLITNPKEPRSPNGSKVELPSFLVRQR